MGLEAGLVELAGLQRLRRRDRRRDVVERMPPVEQRHRHRPVDQAGVEMAQPIVGGEPLAERALAGRGRSVDGDDHVSSPPSPRINSTKLGKLVAMNAASSTCTGFSLAVPSTSADMAMR